MAGFVSPTSLQPKPRTEGTVMYFGATRYHPISAPVDSEVYTREPSTMNWVVGLGFKVLAAIYPILSKSYAKGGSPKAPHSALTLNRESLALKPEPELQNPEHW